MYRHSFLTCMLTCLLFACQPPATSPSLSLDERPPEPTLFGEGLVSTDLYERDIAISPDGKAVIFTLGDYKQSLRCLVGLYQEGQTWKGPEVLPFSGRHMDIEPFFSPDGKRLYFASKRPLPDGADRTDYNLWYVEHDSGNWSEPFPLPATINTEQEEYYPAVTSQGHVYFTTSRAEGIGLEDIYVSRFENGSYLEPVPLDSNINSARYEFNAYVSPDEDLLVFSSYGRPDGLGGGDLYYSQKDASGRWGKAVHLPAPINSTGLDFCPFVDGERNVFYFSSDRASEFTDTIQSPEQFLELARRVQNGMGNIYQVDLGVLGLGQ